MLAAPTVEVDPNLTRFARYFRVRYNAAVATPDPLTAGTTLAYESGVPGSLAAGEQVLWEAHPLPPAARRNPALAVLALLVLPTATALISAAASLDAGFVALWTFIVFALTATALLVARRDDARARREAEHVRYRITNRRVIRADDRRGGEDQQAELARFGSIMTEAGHRSAVTIDGVRFDAVADPNAIVRQMVDLWLRSGRRRQLRRTPVMGNELVIAQDTMTSSAITTPSHAPLNAVTGADAGVGGGSAGSGVSDSGLPPEVVLARGERVLWSGRPRVRDPRDGSWLADKARSVAVLLIPLAIVLSWAGSLPGWAPRAHWAVGLFGGVWLILGLQGVTIEPIRTARRRARTRYVLTNVRAIVHVSGKNGSTRSILLDTVEAVTLRPSSDGAVADVSVGGASFDRLPDAAAAHAVALEAVRVAGTPAGGAFTPPGRDAEGLDL